MDRSHDAWLWVAGACLAVGVAFLGISAALVAAKPPTSHAHWTTTWEAYVAYGFFVAGVMSFVAGIRGARFPFVGQPPIAVSSPARAAVEESSASPQALIDVSRPESPEPAVPQLVFDEAPPELADMSSASLKALFAGRTEAQGKALMKQHVGKPVRVSGEVEGVKLTGTPRVDLRSAVAMLLFFDADDYDPEPVLLLLHIGDNIVVSGQIHEFTEAVVFLDKCRLIETRGRVS